MTVLELKRYDYDRFNTELASIVKQAPNFFHQTPIIVSLDKVNDVSEDIDFIELMEICQEYGLHPIAIRGGTEAHQMAAIIAGLPQLPASKQREAGAQERQPRANESDKTDAAITDNHRPEFSKVIRSPVRSGQQIYAAGGDLIITAPVSAGAEILADGNIHVYGPMRGRALAGVKGNRNALIFCQKLEAELLSIAGHYKISEDLRESHWRQPAIASLSGNQLIIDSL